MSVSQCSKMKSRIVKKMLFSEKDVNVFGILLHLIIFIFCTFVRYFENQLILIK